MAGGTGRVPCRFANPAVPVFCLLPCLAPLPRHHYVRVDSDILMLAIGTGMVRDSIQNLGRM